MNPPLVALRHVDFFERPARLRLPFKFGAVTITHAQQVFVRAVVAVDGKPTTGMAAELLAAKWFDKNPHLSNEENYEQLRQSLRIAARLYIGAGEAVPAFALHAALQPLQYRACALDDLNERLLRTLNDSGRLYLTQTRVGGSYVIRFCVGQTATERRHVEAAWDFIREAARGLNR